MARPTNEIEAAFFAREDEERPRIRIIQEGRGVPYNELEGLHIGDLKDYHITVFGYDLRISRDLQASHPSKAFGYSCAGVDTPFCSADKSAHDVLQDAYVTAKAIAQGDYRKDSFVFDAPGIARKE